MMINKRLINILKEDKKYIAYQVITNWFNLISNIFISFIIATILVNAYNRTLTTNTFIICIVSFVIPMIICYGAQSYSAKLTYLASVKVKDTLRFLIFDKIERIGMRYQQTISTRVKIIFDASISSPLWMYYIIKFDHIKPSYLLQ